MTTKDGTEPQEAAQKIVLREVGDLLRPLFRLLIHHGISFGAFYAIAKSIFVDVARAEFCPGSKGSATFSRLSLLTGLHRKELCRIRKTVNKPAHEPEKASTISRLISTWLGLPRFRAEDGSPLALAREKASGAPSFDELASLVTRDVGPRAMLEVLLTMGIVEWDNDSRIVLRTTAFPPPSRDNEKTQHLLRHVGDHLDAAVSNLITCGAPSLVHLYVHRDELPKAIAVHLQSLDNGVAAALTIDVNCAAAELNRAPRQRFSFCVIVCRAARRRYGHLEPEYRMIQ